MYTRHPFHFVELSPWPLTAAQGAFAVTSGSVLYFHFVTSALLVLSAGLLLILLRAVNPSTLGSDLRILCSVA